jgi:thermolysin
VNNAAFLMTMGGANPVSKTKVAFGIGWEKSEALWYRANTKYFMTTTNFAQAAQGIMQAAKDIALTENEQNIVDCAWKATGVVQGTCAALTDPNPTTPSSRTPGTGTDPGTGADGTATPGTAGTADDTSGTDPGGTTTSKKKVSHGSLGAQDSSGCNVGATGTKDFGPLAGLLAAVFGLAAASRRRKR